MESSSSKRKRDDGVEDEDNEDYYDIGGYLDDESEPHKFGTSVLPVANLPNSFDGVPQDGMEYLFTVRWVLSDEAFALNYCISLFMGLSVLLLSFIGGRDDSYR
jgi:hypothetical protein